MTVAAGGTTTLVENVLVQPSELVTVSDTLYEPAVAKICVGLAIVEVLFAPLEGSPKFHAQPVMVCGNTAVAAEVNPTV